MSPFFIGKRGSPDANGIADKECAAYWRALKRGDFIGIADSEAFEAALSAGAGSKGSIDYTVGDIRRFELRGRDEGRREALGSISFVELSPSGAKEGSGPLYLALVDPEPGSETGRLELRLYFVPEGLEGGTRDEWIDRGDTWLFLPPPNPEDFLSKELEYAPYPDLPPIDGRKIAFGRAGPGEQYAEAIDTGAPSIIVEYEAEADAGGQGPINPLLIVVEEGWMRPDGTEPEEGGYLSLMLGKRLKPGEVEYWPA